MARIPDDLGSRQFLDVVRRHSGALSILDAYDTEGARMVTQTQRTG